MASAGNDKQSSAAEKPRRVLIIVQNLPVPFDRRVWNEATTLQEAGYEVTVICPKGKGASGSHEVLDGIHIYRHALPYEARRALGYPIEYATTLWLETWLAWKVFFARGFDVIHACNPPDLIFLVGLPFKLLFGKKFVFDHHDINPEFYVSKFKRKDIFYKILGWLEYFTFRTADISIATNHSYRDIALGRGGMKPENVFVVRSGPNLDRMKILPPKPDLKQGKRYLVGYVGVIGNSEDIDVLLDAVDYIVNTKGRKDIHFGIVGGGPELNEIRKLASDMGLDDFVTFTGRAPDQDLLEMLNTSDVCVNPERCSDMNDKSTMNKIMEYMSLKKPIVQFDVTEGRFSAQQSSLYARDGDIVDFGDKILELLEDPDRRAQMGEFGFRRVSEQLAWKYEAPKLLRAYDAVFGKRAEAPELGQDKPSPAVKGDA